METSINPLSQCGQDRIRMWRSMTRRRRSSPGWLQVDAKLIFICEVLVGTTATRNWEANLPLSFPSVPMRLVFNERERIPDDPLLLYLVKKLSL